MTTGHTTDHIGNPAAQALVRLLADTVVLRCKARLFAWSAQSSDLSALKAAFLVDYRILDEMCDEYAQWVQTIGGTIPGSYSQFLELASNDEAEFQSPAAMIDSLICDHRQMIADTEFAATLLHDRFDAQDVDSLKAAIDLHENCIASLEVLKADPKVRNH